MFANDRTKPVMGECEACGATDVFVVLRHANIVMCDSCYQEEIKAMNSTRAIKVIEESRHMDSIIELKQDIFNAGTISFKEIQAAVQQNEEIPEDKKLYAIMELVAERVEKLTSVIFADELALTAKKNQRHALTVNAHEIVAKLHEKDREKFKQFDMNYKPVTPKSVKPAKVVKVGKSKKFDKTAVYEAAKKYGVPAPMVQSILVSNHDMTPDDAAKEFARIMGRTV